MSTNGPVVEKLANPFVAEGVNCQFYCDGIFGDTPSSVLKAFEARSAIPGVNPKYNFVAQMLESNGKTGQCLIIATESTHDSVLNAAAYWTYRKSLSNNLIQLKNQAILSKGCAIKLPVTGKDVTILAGNLVHEGIHQLVHNAGLPYQGALVSPELATRFYTNYIKDAAPLARAGVNGLEYNSAAGLLFKAPREIYFNPTFAESLKHSSHIGEIGSALKKAEMMFYQGVSEVQTLEKCLAAYDIPKTAIQASFNQAHGVRSGEIPALIATSDMRYPGAAAKIMPNTYQVNDEVLVRLAKMADSPRPIVSTPEKLYFFDPEINQYQSVPIKDIIPPTMPASVAKNIWKTGLRWGAKTLKFTAKVVHYGALPGMVAGEHYLNGKAWDDSIISGSSKWAIDTVSFGVLASYVSAAPAATFLAIANLADAAPDLLTLHKEQIKQAPDIRGMTPLQAKRALDDFYETHPYARSEMVMNGVMQRVFSVFSSRQIFEHVVHPLIRAQNIPNSLDGVPLPTFGENDVLTPENERELAKFQIKNMTLFGVEDFRVEQHLLAKKKADLLEKQRQQENEKASLSGANGIDEASDVGVSFSGTAPSMAGSLSSEFSTIGFQSVGSDQAGIYQCSADSPFLTNLFSPDEIAGIHSLLSDLNKEDSVSTDVNGDVAVKSDAEPESRARYAPKKKAAEEDKAPFIKDVKIGNVGGSVGLLVTLAKGGVVGFAPQAGGGFVVTVTAEFTKDFLVAFAGAAGVGLAIAGVAFVAQHFYNQHQRHIAEGIAKDFSYTQKDLAFINQQINHLASNIDVLMPEQAIAQTNGLLRHNNGKIAKLETRAQDARQHKKPEYANAQNAAARQIAEQNKNLKASNESIRLQQMANAFVKENQQADPYQLLLQAQALSGKGKLSAEDLAKLQGIDSLVREKAAHLVAQGKLDDAEALLKQAGTVQFYLPGNLETLGFGAGMGTVDRRTSGDLTTINKAIQHINDLISQGKDPSSAIRDLIDHIDNREGVRDNLTERKGNRKDPKHGGHKTNSSDYVSCQQWDSRIQAFDAFRAKLAKWLEQYQDGNPPQSFEVEAVVANIALLKEMQNASADVWLEELNRIAQKKSDNLTEADIHSRNFLTKLSTENISELIFDGDLTKARELATKLVTGTPENDVRGQQLLDAISELELNTAEANFDWAQKLVGIAGVPEGDRSLSQSIQYAYANRKSVELLFDKIAKGELAEAKILAETLSADDAQSQRFQRIATNMATAIDNSNASSEHWLNELDAANVGLGNNIKESDAANDGVAEITDGIANVALDDNQGHVVVDEVTEGMAGLTLDSDNQEQTKEPTVEASSVSTDPLVLAAQRAVAIRSLNAKATDLESRGFNGAARDLGVQMMAKDKELAANVEFKNQQDDRGFTHDGQVISLVIRPVQQVLTRYVAGMEEGYKKNIANFGIEAVGAAQIVCPNALTLLVQGGYAKYYQKDLTVFNRNAGKILTEIGKDLKNPVVVAQAMNTAFREGYKVSFTQGITESTKAGFKEVSFNSVMIYSQLGLLAVRASSVLDRLVPEKYQSQLKAYQEARQQVVYYGGKTIEVAWGANAVYTLSTKGIWTANAPMLVASVGKLAFDGSCWAIHWKQKRNGNSCETSGRYHTEEVVSTSIGAVGGTAALTAIAGPLGFIGGALLFGGATIYSANCQSTRLDCSRKALQGALGNIHHREQNSPGKHNHSTSFSNIDSELTNQFGDGEAKKGYCYDRKNPNSIENAARQALWQYKIKGYVEQKSQEGHNSIVSWSGAQSEGKDIYVDSWFKLPAHLVWQGLCYYVLPSHIKYNLGGFKSQYDVYSKGIYETCSVNWYEEHFPQVREALTSLHCDAIHRYVEAAQNESKKEVKLNYLRYVLLDFGYSTKAWTAQLQVEHRFAAAEISFGLDDKALCKTFLEGYDWPAYVQSKSKKEFTRNAALMLEEVNVAQCHTILTHNNREVLGVDDSMINGRLYRLMKDLKLEEAATFAKQVPNYGLDKFYKNFNWYFMPSQLSPVTALDHLAKVKQADRGLNYWRIMHGIVGQCLNSVKYNPNKRTNEAKYAQFYGLLKIFADELQRFDSLSAAEKQYTSEAIDNATQYLSGYVNILRKKNRQPLLRGDALKADVEKLYQQGHAMLRGEGEVSLSQFVDDALYGLSYSFSTNGLRKSYVPIEVAPDGECAFSTLGVTRADAVKLLKEVINADKEPSGFNKIIAHLFGKDKSVGKELHETVFNLLINELESINNSKFNRDKSQKDLNRESILSYIDNHLSQKSYFLHCHQQQSGAFEAIALLYGKNLNIFISNEDGELTQFNSKDYHQPDFATVDVMITHAQGFGVRGNPNHYVKLLNTPYRVEEMFDDFEEDLQEEKEAVPPSFTPGFATKLNGGLKPTMVQPKQAVHEGDCTVPKAPQYFSNLSRQDTDLNIQSMRSNR